MNKDINVSGSEMVFFVFLWGNIGIRLIVVGIVSFLFVKIYYCVDKSKRDLVFIK